jgi:hypothetical protein
MKIRRRFYFIGGSILLAMIITGFGLAAALENSWGGFRHGKGFHRGFGHKDIGEFVLWRVDKQMKELNLNGGQQDKYNQIRSNIEKHLTEGMDERKVMRETFHSEMSKDNPKVRPLVEMMKKKIDEVSGIMGTNLDLVVGFYESLNVDQKNKILNEIRDRMEAHH